MAAAALAFGIGVGNARASIEVLDDAGTPVRLERPATRIVSLSPHLTEQLFAIGVGDRIVGTTEFSDHPAAAQRITRVARAHSVDLERVAAVKADLIVIWGSGFPPGIIEAVRRLGVPLFVSEPKSLDDIASSMERLGELTGVDGSSQAGRFRMQVSEVKKRYAGRSEVRVFYQVWSSPLMTLSGRHVISEAITLCGGRNVFADLAPIAPQVSIEAVIAANPQVIITAEADGKPSGALDEWKRFSQLAAVRNAGLVTIDANRINRHGPRLPDEITALCEAIDRGRRAESATGPRR